jgi:hypothetical protein
MFDDFTFALRYGPEVTITHRLIAYRIPTPVTAETIDRLKTRGVWERFEPIIGPYVVND